MMRLAEFIGRQRAHDLVYEACLLAIQGENSLRSSLLKVPEVAAVLSEEDIDDLLDPTNYIGLAPDVVDAIATED